MSRIIVDSLKGPIDRAFGLLAQFIEVCPENVWNEKNGGWPVWQQIYHSLIAVNLFADLPQATPLSALAAVDICGLKAVGATALSKAQVQAACVEAKALVDQYVAALTDEDLPKRNETVFKKIHMDLSQAATLSFLAGHTLYHLGAGDAALRDHGLAGVF